MNCIFQAWIGLIFSNKKKNSVGNSYPYRTLFVPDDVVEKVHREPRYSVALKSFSGMIKGVFDHSLNQIEKMKPAMFKLIYFAFFFGCVVGVGGLYDINSPATVGLRTAMGICCVLFALVSGVSLFNELDKDWSR